MPGAVRSQVICKLPCRQYIGHQFKNNVSHAHYNDVVASPLYSILRTRTCVMYTPDARLANQEVAPNDTAAKNDSQFDADPFDVMQGDLHEFLYGGDIETDVKDEQKRKLIYGNKNESTDMQQAAKGDALRSELFQEESAVHMTAAELVHRGYYVLNITTDYMQTAVNAFSIFLYGTIKDIERLPPDYVLRSARTISMMKIAREKLVATWQVVKARKETKTITYETLELYRPLFKYINGREMARLNLSDERILAYIGTHVDLNRHQDGVTSYRHYHNKRNTNQATAQILLKMAFAKLRHEYGKSHVGIIASKYINNNKRWAEPRSMNLMNNLLCGVPIVLMRKVPVCTYLQLSHQALGKSNSWSAQDVSKLGLLLAEVDGNDLASINPKAMAGITAEVMSKMSARNLKYFTRAQLENIGRKPLNILAKKLGIYQEFLDRSSSEHGAHSDKLFAVVLLICLFINVRLFIS